VCAPSLLGGPTPLKRPTDLARFHLLHDDDHSFWQTWLKAAGVSGVDVRRGTVFTDSGMLLQAAMGGQGVAIARSVLVSDALEAGALVRPFDLSMTTRFAYYLLALPERYEQDKRIVRKAPLEDGRLRFES